MNTLHFGFYSIIMIVFTICFVLSGNVNGQNVGIGTNSPTQKLEVNGKIKLSDDSGIPAAGTIRWDDSKEDFEGFDGNEWRSLTKQNNNYNSNCCEKSGLGTIDYVAQATCDDGSQGELFGFSVDISDNYAVIGKPFESADGMVNKGSVYIFKRFGERWKSIHKLTAPDALGGDLFGYSVKIKIFEDLNTIYITVGAPGKQISGNAGQGAFYVIPWLFDTTPPSGTLLTDPSGQANDSMGYSVSRAFRCLNHVKIAAGAPNAGGGGLSAVGKVCIFSSENNFSSIHSTILPFDGNSGDKFGKSLDADSCHLVVGAPNTDKDASHLDAGAVYIYKDITNDMGTSWTDVARIAVDEPGVIDNFFGNSVSITYNCIGSGVCAIIGAPNYDYTNSDDNHGRTYIYRTTPGNNDWVKAAELAVGDEGVTEDKWNKPPPKKMGYSVSIHKSIAFVGSPDTEYYHNCNSESIEKVGRGYLFFYADGIWNHLSTVTDYPTSGHLLGSQGGLAVAVYNRRCIMGVPYADPNRTTDQGKVIISKADAQRALD
jgi:hypothetical protein